MKTIPICDVYLLRRVYHYEDDNGDRHYSSTILGCFATIELAKAFADEDIVIELEADTRSTFGYRGFFRRNAVWCDDELTYIFYTPPLGVEDSVRYKIHKLPLEKQKDNEDI